MHAAVFRWRLDGREGIGAYELMVRVGAARGRVIRALISDFGGVLTTPLAAGFLAYQEEARISLEDLGRAMQAAAEAYGEHPLLRARARRDQRAGVRAPPRRAARTTASTSAGLRELYFERLEPNAPMIEFIGEQRGRGLRTALLTNNVREWEPLWRAKLPELDEIFEIVVDSAFVGHAQARAAHLRAHDRAARRRPARRGLPVRRRHRGSTARPRARSG